MMQATQGSSMEAVDHLSFRRPPHDPPTGGGPGHGGGTAAAHRIAIFNVKYSPNLGDGIIAECLEGELRRADPLIDPVSIDLAGRTGFSRRHGRSRMGMLSIIEMLPPRVRSVLVPALLLVLVRFRLAPRWRRWLAKCDGVIVGGGALFQDVDQNFPVKIAQGLKLANARKLPVAIASVGVSGGWSAAGRSRLAARLLGARLVSVSVRDVDSVTMWRSVMGALGVGEAALAPDPGLLSARQYGSPRKAAEPGCIGLCVTAPIALRLHHEGAHDDGQHEAWMRAAARELMKLGRDVVMFTNGSPEDRLFRDRLQLGLERYPGIRFAPDFSCPEELAHALAGFDCVLAHRLHACIVAYSYKVPTVGFAWDRKLRSFFEQTGRAGFVIDPRETSPMHLADLASIAIELGIDEDVHADLVGSAAGAIHALAQKLTASGADMGMRPIGAPTSVAAGAAAR
jgi:polysaccharide pyruvyl transferase WcaK-like protein